VRAELSTSCVGSGTGSFFRLEKGHPSLLRSGQVRVRRYNEVKCSVFRLRNSGVWEDILGFVFDIDLISTRLVDCRASFVIHSEVSVNR
jgi:hypothetical protein